MVAQHSRKKKVALGVIITLICVVVAVLIGFNLYIRIAYSSFYSKAQEEFAIPGVNNGFICQDLDTTMRVIVGSSAATVRAKVPRRCIVAMRTARR